MKQKFVYFFSKKKSEGSKEMKNLLGGKGAGLVEMTSIGLPVPGGLHHHHPDLRRVLQARPQAARRACEKEVKRAHAPSSRRPAGKKFGDADDPLLVSVRSGAARSMPGMMETILNLGLNDVSVEGLAEKTGNPRFAYDAYRRFIQMYSTTAMGLSKEPMEDMLHDDEAQAGRQDRPGDPGREPQGTLRAVQGVLQARRRARTSRRTR